jgi:hypothetical protein
MSSLGFGSSSNSYTQPGTTPGLVSKISSGLSSGLSGVSSGLSEAKRRATSGLAGVGKTIYNNSNGTALASSLIGSLSQVKLMGGRRRHHHRTYRGGQSVTAYNTYNDPSTASASPVSGYPTAMPQNFVGGRRTRRTRRTRRNRRKNRRTRRR